MVVMVSAAGYQNAGATEGASAAGEGSTSCSVQRRSGGFGGVHEGPVRRCDLLVHPNNPPFNHGLGAAKRSKARSIDRAFDFYGGGAQSRTGVRAFAGPCLSHSATPPGESEPSRLPEGANSPRSERQSGPESRTARAGPECCRRGRHESG